MSYSEISIRPLLGIFLATLSCAGLARAEDRLPSLEEATAQLLTAYGRNASHLARYESLGENKSLKCTLARDELSGLIVVHWMAHKGVERTECRMWNTDDDRMYASIGGALTVTRGLQEEVSVIEKLGKVLANDGIKESQMYAFVLLGKESLESGLGFGASPTAPWESSLKEASVLSMDDQTITFETKEYGQLSISRKTGMLERQKIKGKEGEDRVLELKEFKRDPDRKVIEDMTKDWSTLGAKDANLVPYTLPLRLMLFQEIIKSVESGASDLGKLETTLDEQKEALRQFSELCAARDVDSPLAQAFRRIQLPDKDRIRKAWITKTGAKADDEKGFQEFLTSRRFRQDASAELLGPFVDKPDMINKVMTLILGVGVWQNIKTQDQAGEAARNLCGKAMARSYLDLMLEHRMNQAWGRPDALD